MGRLLVRYFSKNVFHDKQAVSTDFGFDKFAFADFSKKFFNIANAVVISSVFNNFCQDLLWPSIRYTLDKVRPVLGRVFSGVCSAL